MAPELVLNELAKLPKDAVVLDPMTGSGTVIRTCVERGLTACGFDMDPLAVLMSRVWTSPLKAGLEELARAIVQEARANAAPTLPLSITSSNDTLKFMNFWFEDRQQKELSALADAVDKADLGDQDALKLALSRVIITKENGASIARDTSHSRPHRTFFNNKFSVFDGFILAARRIEQRHKSDLIIGNARIEEGDARHLPVLQETFDAVITSPPYLNAIDYMRGHRLALIWLGYGLDRLRSVRATSIGCEAGRESARLDLSEAVREWDLLPSRHQKMVNRYADDITELMVEMRRVLKPGGTALLVVGNSVLNGRYISNATINVLAAQAAGLMLDARFDREIPSGSRYLPVGADDSSLGRRMRTETVLRFAA